jgi:hypothetical protein
MHKPWCIKHHWNNRMLYFPLWSSMHTFYIKTEDIWIKTNKGAQDMMIHFSLYQGSSCYYTFEYIVSCRCSFSSSSAAQNSCVVCSFFYFIYPELKNDNATEKEPSPCWASHKCFCRSVPWYSLEFVCLKMSSILDTRFASCNEQQEFFLSTNSLGKQRNVPPLAAQQQSI